MININLEFNETVIVKCEDIHFDTTSKSKGRADVLLTNMRVVVISKGIFGKVKETLFFPMEDIKRYNGKPQVKYSEKDGQALIDLYTTRMQIELKFDSDKKKEAKSFVYEMNKLLCSDEDFEEWKKENKLLAMTTPEEVVKTIVGTIGSIKDSIIPPVPGSSVCNKCGGLIQGYVGKPGKCTFCGNQQVIKE